ncbi:MAG TPA: hypothetical protein DCS05_09485, partial [Nitrospiraceae bacterium]|nr:hypothetical protein [Nitrospiraceae bacterium]
MLAKRAIEFAISQRKSEYWEQLWRGAIIGGMLGRFQANSAAGDDAAGENGIEQRLMLQDLVIAEVQKYGHPSNNKGLSLTGESSRLYGMFRNSIDAKGNFSDLLKGTLEGSGNQMEFDSSNLQSIVEHLFIREQVTEISLEDLQKIYSGDKAIGTLGDLAETEEVAITPDGLVMPLSRYLAGDIYAKLDAMYLAMASETDPRLIAAYERQIAEIEAKRKLTSVENMNFTLQQPWLPKRMIRDFMEQAGYTVRYGTVQTVERENALTGKMEQRSEFVEDYDTPFGSWQLATMAGRGYSKEISWTKKLQGFDLRLEGYLNGKGITHNANQSSEDDKDIIQQYREREKALNEGLTAFIQTNPDVETVAEGFNRKFNGYIPFEYSEDDLNLKGINPRFKLHTYQNAAVRRLSEEGSGILGFGVGLGKTASSLALVKYNQQMGRSKRTCIVVPASVLSNWYHEAKGLYGDLDGALFIGVQPVRDKDGTIRIEPVLDEAGQPKTDKQGNQIYNDVLEPNNNAEQVYTAMWEIPQSNYKIVVMTKDRFKMIPVKDDTVDAFADSMKAALEASKAGQETDKKKKKGKSYKDAVDEANDDARFHDEGTAKEGAYPFFEDMGFTDVILDEAHVAKNGIGPSNRYTGGKVAYLAPPVTSQIAIDMQIKMHHIKRSNNGRGAYLLTATPITNSLIECYNMLALVVPKEEFERRSIYTVDDFINTFGRIEQTQKLDPQGELFDTDALLGYENLDGLRDMFFKFANMKSSDEVKELRDSLPEADYLDHDVDMNDEQRQAYAQLCKQGKDKDKATRRPKLAIIRDMDKVTTDIDLFYNRITWHFPLSEKAKVDAMVADLPATVKGKQRPEPGDAEFDPDKTEEQQKIVVMQIPLKPQYTAKTDGQTYIITTPQAYEESVLTRLKKFDIAEESISHPLTPKYAALIENCKKEMELGGKQIIFT